MAMEQGIEWSGSRTLAVPFPNRTATIRKRNRPALPMATPPPTGYRNTNLVLSPLLAAYVDQQAKRFGISKAGFVRMLIARDMEAQAPAASVA
jgi:hypothetical protein